MVSFNRYRRRALLPDLQPLASRPALRSRRRVHQAVGSRAWRDARKSPAPARAASASSRVRRLPETNRQSERFSSPRTGRIRGPSPAECQAWTPGHLKAATPSSSRTKISSPLTARCEPSRVARDCEPPAMPRSARFSALHWYLFGPGSCQRGLRRFLSKVSCAFSFCCVGG